jgi:flagellar L-ring protein precursor FlgH
MTTTRMPALRRQRRAAIGLAMLLSSTAVLNAMAADLVNTERFTPLTADRRGVATGDIVTILVVENSSATNSADMKSDKSYGIGGEISTLAPRRQGFQASIGDQTDGRGAVTRSGRMVAQLSVRVQEVYPNGDLFVKGDQEINVNGEKTRISLEGRLRPRDITDGNVALSSRLAEARIEYVGDGYLSERARPGLIPRIFNWLGLW